MHFLLAQCYSAERIWILFTSYTYTRATRTQRALTHACTQGNIMRSRSLAHVRIFIYTPPTLSLGAPSPRAYVMYRARKCV